jgi:hypothetical protein
MRNIRGALRAAIDEWGKAATPDDVIIHSYCRERYSVTGDPLLFKRTWPGLTGSTPIGICIQNRVCEALSMPPIL